MSSKVSALEMLERELLQAIEKCKESEINLRNNGYGYEADTVATASDTIHFALKKIQSDLAIERSKLQ